MMDAAEFAALRRDRLSAADDELRELVRAALSAWDGEGEFQPVDLLEAVEVLWLEHFSAEAPHADYERFLPRFREVLTESLSKTSGPADSTPADHEVERVTIFLSTLAVNDGTMRGAGARGVRFKRWNSMHDPSVRHSHEAADGQIRPIAEPFDVSGVELQYPGHPVGPPEAWINCRCLVQPAAARGDAAMTGTTFTIDGLTTDAGSPETPAAGEYDGDAVTFDQVGLSAGPEQEEFEMAGKSDDVTANLAAARASLEAKVASGEIRDLVASGGGWTAPAGQVFDIEGVEVELEDDEMPVDELEDGEEEITEIPVHGVATIEGRATGDGRGFRPNAITVGKMPQPLGYEYVSTHGGDTSNVAVVGRIDEYWRHEVEENVFEIRWRGVIMPGKEYGARAIESIIDGSYTGLSVIVDDIEVDVSEQREQMRQRLVSEHALADDERPTDDDIEAMLDDMVGDGTQPVTWFSLARTRRFDMVPTGAFQEAYIELGHEFLDELTPDQIEASARALEDCGCLEGSAVVDLTSLTEEELATYDAMTLEEQEAFVAERGLTITASAGAPEREGAFRPAPFAPGTKDGPGWITHPTATARIRRYWVRGKGAAKIKWGVPGDFNRCRAQLAKYVQNPEWLAGLCANMHKEAIGVWPGQEGGGRHSIVASGAAPAPLVVLASAERTIYPSSAFQEPTDSRPFPMRIDREARTISGYAASWDSCHIGIAGMCQQAPQSRTDYSYFRKGVVDTDAGEQRVGLITASIGHAGEQASAAAATAHYDQTDAVRAYINIGENAFGIWYAGVLAPETTDAQIDEMRAIGRVSGDWRSWSGVRGDLEMVGLVVVNTEGFQLAASGGVQTAAIGVGALPAEPVEAMVASAAVEAEAEAEVIELDTDALALAVAEKVIDIQERRALASRVAPAREAVRARALANARRKIEEK